MERKGRSGQDRVLAHELGHELMHDLGNKYFSDEHELAVIQREDKFQEIEAELFTMRTVERLVGPTHFNTRYALGYIKNQLREGELINSPTTRTRLQEANERVNALISDILG